jgi:hypothetical protein
VSEVFPETHTLPDGTEVPHTAFFADGVVTDWTGAKCRRCDGSGEHVHPFDHRERHTCSGCGGTGEGHGPTWRWEE